MYQAYKLLDIVKECFCLESEQELADFFDMNLNELGLIRNGKQELSIESKLIILNRLVGYDENGASLFEKIDSACLFHSLCRIYSLNTCDFLKKGNPFVRFRVSSDVGKSCRISIISTDAKPS